jgi:hypothetical protein
MCKGMSVCTGSDIVKLYRVDNALIEKKKGVALRCIASVSGSMLYTAMGRRLPSGLGK